MRVRLLLSLLIMFIFTSVATAQTAEEIIEKNVAARGGAEKFAAIHSIMVKTVEEANWGGRGSSALSIMRPDRMRFYYEWRGSPKAKPITIVWAFDGEVAWSADQRKGLQAPIKMTGDDLGKMREMATSQFAESFNELKANGNAVELVGKDAVDGAQCYKIRFTHGDTVLRYAYYDQQSFLVVRSELIGHRKSKEDHLGVAVTDYRNVDGILFPHTFKIESVDASPFALARGLPLPFVFVGNKKNSTTSTVQSIEINPDMDERSFQIPGNARAEPAKH
jgi:outer membrane lipoprotein-sorting protein